MVGVQVKNHPGKRVSCTEAEAAIVEAEAFMPPLTHFIFATSSTRNATLTARYARLSQERSQQGKFTVEVIFWEDLSADLTKYHDLVRVHYPELAGRLVPPEPNLYVTFRDAATDITVDADWRSWEGKQIRPLVERHPPTHPHGQGLGVVNHPALCFRPPKPPGTAPIYFTIENHTTLEAKQVLVRIQYAPGMTAAIESLWPSPQNPGRVASIVRMDDCLIVKAETLYHRPTIMLEPITLAFPRANETYELHWSATAGNKLTENIGVLRIHVR
jgi:hypothetical protein